MTAAEVRGDEFTETVVPVLETYCYDCHDGDSLDPKGDFDLFPFYTTADARGDLESMLQVRNALHFREMPPPEKTQPEEAERQLLIDWIDQQLLLAPTLPRDTHDPGPPQSRRLTRLEYNNTVRDLLGLQSDLFLFSERLMARRDYFDPSVEKMPEQLDIFIPEYGAKVPSLLRFASLPGDSRSAHGFFNQGDGLDITPVLIQKYLAVATEIVEHDSFGGEARRLAALTGVTPAPRTTPAQASSGSGHFPATLHREFAPVDNIEAEAPGSSDQSWLFRDHLSAAFDTGHGGVFQHPDEIGARVPGKGGIIRAAFGRDDEKALIINPTETLWFVDFGTAHESSPPTNIANSNQGQKRFRLALSLDGVREDEGIVNLGVVVLSRAKESAGPVTLTAHFASGETASLSDEIATGAGVDNTFFSWYAPPGDKIVGLEMDGSKFSGDYVLLDDLGVIIGKVAEVEQKAPHPTVSATSPPAEVPDQTIGDARASFDAFLERAFRREVSAEESEPYFALYQRAIVDGSSKESATAETIRAVLSSPRFLMINERAGEDHGPVRRLDGFEIATRLSYFLWASMPDDELFAAVEKGELGTAAGIEAQVRRMLRDPKSKELSDSFAYQWLRLNALSGSQPNSRRFPAYYSGINGKETLAAPMLQEALLLFETCLIENRPLFDLIDPDFTWLNARLIRLYGFEDLYADQLVAAETIDKNGRKRLDQNRWFRCALPDRTRGGILCMGGTLTLTSLPLRTSPVYRGAWVTETVFNRPPPPPPAMVDELGADTRSIEETGLTLRQKLEQHREQPACAGCHTRIDPLGFPLENYDPIGQWRESYSRFPIDSGGTLNGGIPYDGIVEFKDALAGRKDDFHRGFARHLLTYALARKLAPADERTIAEIAAVADQGGLADVIVAIATSYPFTHTRTSMTQRDE